uniref:Reverse transcriptase domain-containing protein n=1 Tax=Nicotiana tabacum TaxID=4097 RepID=A0A1S3YV59_TOBAC|nr:PREDICTED: uncharacterized protein LOC107779870 [Nicotiana tabacum]
MQCVQTVSYSILINGKPCAPFEAKRGLRQGDPLSPFLFVIAMEYLTRLLKTLKRVPNFNYHPRCEKMQIVQLGFADDLLLLCRGDADFYMTHFKASPMFQVINKNKSYIFFGGVNESNQQIILQRLGFNKGGNEITKNNLLTWDRICWPQIAGGLNIAISNRAAIGKQFWNL